MSRRRLRPFVLVAHSYYEEDPRVRRQAEAILASGRPVDVVSLRREGDARHGDVEGVRVHRMDVQRHQGAGIGTYLAEYLRFFLAAGAYLARNQPIRHWALVQVATLPDWLVFAALPLRLAGVPVILDLHEAMPEFFRSRFPRANNPVVRRALLWSELASIRMASHAITVNDALRERLLGLGVEPDAISVVPNTPSLARFDPGAHPGRAFMADGTLRLVYAGGLTPIYEVDVLLRAVARLAVDRPDLPIAVDVYGRGDAQPALEALAAELGVADRVAFHGRIALEAVPAAIARADVGVAPTRRDPFTDASLSTKIFEYAAMGKPVVCTRLPMVERTFPEGTVWPYEAGDPASLAGRLLGLVDDPAAREAAAAATRSLVTERSWETDAVAYLALLERYARRL